MSRSKAPIDREQIVRLLEAYQNRLRKLLADKNLSEAKRKRYLRDIDQLGRDIKAVRRARSNLNR